MGLAEEVKVGEWKRAIKQANDIHLSLDLVEASRNQLDFLKEVDKNPGLYQGKDCVNLYSS